MIHIPQAAAAARIAGQPGIVQEARLNNLSLVADHITADPASVHAREASGQTALLSSAWNGHTEVCRLLISAKSDVNVCDIQYDYTPLPYFFEEEMASYSFAPFTSEIALTPPLLVAVGLR